AAGALSPAPKGCNSPARGAAPGWRITPFGAKKESERSSAETRLPGARLLRPLNDLQPRSVALRQDLGQGLLAVGLPVVDAELHFPGGPVGLDGPVLYPRQSRERVAHLLRSGRSGHARDFQGDPRLDGLLRAVHGPGAVVAATARQDEAHEQHARGR